MVEAAPADPITPADRAACSALTVMDLQEATSINTRLTAATVLPAKDDQPALCRINGLADPQVGFEVRLPLQGWNGRLLVTGCSNLCGIIQVQGMEDALARGYATATTDMGHQTGDTGCDVGLEQSGA
ncbi:MAG: tannase/feruloyl esterase family alpha/beta hydrolase [Gammaproteobacteria bacterium]